jgi:hypothetical protein
VKKSKCCHPGGETLDFFPASLARSPALFYLICLNSQAVAGKPVVKISTSSGAEGRGFKSRRQFLPWPSLVGHRLYPCESMGCRDRLFPGLPAVV